MTEKHISLLFTYCHPRNVKNKAGENQKGEKGMNIRWSDESRRLEDGRRSDPIFYFFDFQIIFQKSWFFVQLDRIGERKSPQGARTEGGRGKEKTRGGDQNILFVRKSLFLIPTSEKSPDHLWFLQNGGRRRPAGGLNREFIHLCQFCECCLFRMGFSQTKATTKTFQKSMQNRINFTKIFFRCEKLAREEALARVAEERKRFREAMRALVISWLLFEPFQRLSIEYLK